MVHLGRNNFLRRIFILNIYFFLINFCFNKTYADIVKSFDLMPFENNSSILELNLASYSNNFFPNTIGSATTNSLKLNKNSIVKIGFLSSGYNKYGFDLQFSNTEFKTKYSQENINPLSINFRLIRPNAFGLLKIGIVFSRHLLGLYLSMKFNVMKEWLYYWWKIRRL